MNIELSLKSRQTLSLLAKENSIWLKPTGDGPESLFKALSNAIYFTDVHHLALKSTIVNYFRAESKFRKYKFFFANDLSLAEKFLENPSDPIFESLVLEIASFIFKSRFKLFYIENDVLCSLLYFRKTKRKYCVFKLCQGIYAALFKRMYKQILPFAQNLVLSLVESSMAKKPFKLVNLNKGNFTNFEYEAWKFARLNQLTTQKNQESLKERGFDFSCNKSIDSRSHISYSLGISRSSAKSKSSEGNQEGLRELVRKAKAEENNKQLPKNKPAGFVENENVLTLLAENQGQAKCADEKGSGNFNFFSDKMQFENDNLEREINVDKANHLFNGMSQFHESLGSAQNTCSRIKEGNFALFDENEELSRSEKSIVSNKKSRSCSNSVKKEHTNKKEVLAKEKFGEVKNNSNLAERKNLPSQLKKLPEERKSKIQRDASGLKKEQKMDPQIKTEFCETSFEFKAVDKKKSDSNFRQEDFFPSFWKIGRLKFYDKEKKFGLLSIESKGIDNSDCLFVEEAELLKAGEDLKDLNGFFANPLRIFKFEVEKRAFQGSVKEIAVNLKPLVKK